MEDRGLCPATINHHLMGMRVQTPLLADGETTISHWLEKTDALLESNGGAELLGDKHLSLFLLHNLNALSTIHSNAKEFTEIQKTVCAAFEMTPNTRILMGFGPDSAISNCP